MNFGKIGIVIGREYSTRVKKKSFLVTTFLVPVLFAALCILPSLVMFGMKDETKRIAVMDESGIVGPVLVSDELAEYVHLDGTMSLDSVKNSLGSLGYDAVLHISPLDVQGKTVSAAIYSEKPVGLDLKDDVASLINSAVEDYRIDTYGIDGLGNIIKEITPDIPLRTYTISEDGSEKVSESAIYMIVSVGLGMIIYMFITLFGGMVSSSVIEEKSSRVVEVLISSVKATELMFGKIIGIALVALTQFLLWVLLTVALVGIAGAAMGPKLAGGLSDSAQVVAADPASSSMMAGLPADSDLNIILSSLLDMHIGQILVCFVVFFILGYMLYASLFAAIGSAVENEGDSSQLTMPVTIPLLLGFFIAIYAFKAPDSAVVFWSSMIPFTSPIVMLARLPFGVPFWEIGLSVALLLVTFVLFAWLSAKVYKVGILMFGKKSGWKDLWKWLKQK